MIINYSDDPASDSTVIYPTSKYTDIQVLELGHEIPAPGYHVGPRIRREYLIHFVFEGTAKYNHLTAQQGNAFLIIPDQMHTIECDNSRKYEQAWICFSGPKAPEILANTGIPLVNQVLEFQDIQGVHNRIINICKNMNPEDISENLMLSTLFYLLSVLKPPSGHWQMIPTRQNRYVEQAINFIIKNYQFPIQIGDIAKAINVSSKYLWALFDQEIGMSPKQCLTAFRMEKANRLLASTDLTISTIATTVGYQNSITFIEQYKKYFNGQTPTKYRSK